MYRIVFCAPKDSDHVKIKLAIIKNDSAQIIDKRHIMMDAIEEILVNEDIRFNFFNDDMNIRRSTQKCNKYITSYSVKEEDLEVYFDKLYALLNEDKGLLVWKEGMPIKSTLSIPCFSE